MGKKAVAKSAVAEIPKSLPAGAHPGERPPRPSHGHKWDEGKQQWVGKGSLDERKAAKLKESAPKEAADGTVLKSWQSMPTQLLLEWTKREKRPNPYYQNSRSWDQSKWHKKVVLTDTKNKDASLEFTPWDDSDTEACAKEHAALVALLKVQGSMPLDRKLPPPYCDLWKVSVAGSNAEPKSKTNAKAKDAAKADSVASVPGGAEAAPCAADGEAAFKPPLRSGLHFTSKAERDAAEREKKRERNTREAKRRANAPAPVLLSRKMRVQLREALGLDDAWEAASVGMDVDMGDMDAEAMTRCIQMGFQTAEVMSALASTNAELDPGAAVSVEARVEQLRHWLCLHLPEDELPEGFSADKGQFSVHTSKTAKGSSSSDDFTSAVESLTRWLHGELSGRLDSSSADALLSTIELVLSSVSPALADRSEADEASENVACILSCESDELEDVAGLFRERWGAIWSTHDVGNAAELKVIDTNCVSDDDAVASVKDDTELANASTTCDEGGFWETGSESNVSIPAREGRARGDCRPWFGSETIGSQALAVESLWSKSPSGQKMAKHRECLPAAASREELVRLCPQHPVVFVQGETGCGKTTQVGQFLLESDPTSRIIVTQPRRVAATSVAQRVSDERGETLGEGSVGYSVRGESKLRRDRCRLLFCTNGVLLRRLLAEPENMFSQRTCTHLVIDEVHERSVEIDFVLTLLREFLPQRTQLRVILMSATMDIELLARMFPARPPSVKMPGRTFPVKQLFLDDVQDQLGLKTWSASAKSGRPAQTAPGNDVEEEGGSAAAGARAPAYLSQLDFGGVAEVALSVLRGQLRDAPEDGALLIFVPGVGEIDRLSREIGKRAAKSEAFVLPLHGGLPSEHQRRCFEIPSKRGPRKIVVSTNVAETSVTVPDVTVVIDTCRERRLQLDPGAVAPCLAETVCARSSLIQRKGRAGRVRAGVCITMLSRRDYEKLAAEAPPEIEAAALESVCLQVRASGFVPLSFLAKMPTPPRPERIAATERLLAKIGATRSSIGDVAACDVTALGRHLAALPCDVHVGKMLVVGALLGVISMSADVAAMLSVRSPLKSVARDPKAAVWRDHLRQTLLPGGTKSDHCLLAKLLQLWIEAGGRGTARRELCQNAAVVWERMAEAAVVRSQLLGALRGLGFDTRRDDRNAGEWRSLRVAVTAAFYPQIAKVKRPPAEFVATTAGAVEKQAEARQLRYFVQVDPTEGPQAEQFDSHGNGEDMSSRWKRESRAFLHPASLLFQATSYSCPYVIFSSKQVQQTRGSTSGFSTKLNLSEVSEASIYALLLFCGTLRHDGNEVVIDDWIRFSCGSATVIALVYRLKSEIERVLLQKIQMPWFQIDTSPVCQVLSTLLSTDGLG